MNPRRTCPTCGEDVGEILYPQRFTSIQGSGLLSGYDVTLCRACGMGYADAIPAAAVFEAYYRDQSRYEMTAPPAGGLNDYDLRRFPLNADLIVPHLPGPHARILDIGCAVGGQLWALQQRGFSNLVGLDPSPQCARIAHERFGLKVLTGALFDLDIQEGPFDLILLGSVLEHLRDPLPSLHRVERLLAPDGLLYVEVPDALRFAKLLDAPFQEFSMEHINYFSPRSLTNLLSRIGHSPVFCRQTLIQQTPSKKVGEIKALFRKASSRTWKADTETGGALREYIRVSQALEQQVWAQLEALAHCQEPLVVWGAGTHTQHLLASSPLARVPINAYVDSNPQVQGLTLDGIPILAPETLQGHREPILISSQQFQDDIIRQIREELRLPNRLILLYASGKEAPQRIHTPAYPA